MVSLGRPFAFARSRSPKNSLAAELRISIRSPSRAPASGQTATVPSNSPQQPVGLDHLVRALEQLLQTRDLACVDRRQFFGTWQGDLPSQYGAEILEPLLQGRPRGLLGLQTGEQGSRIAGQFDQVQNPPDRLVQLRQFTGQPITIARIVCARCGQRSSHLGCEMFGQMRLDQTCLP